MGQKTEINSLQELIDWIDNSKICCFEEISEEYFIIEAPDNATRQIQFKKDDEIDDIILKTIEQLEEFDADNEFMELWSVDFAKHNHFKPSQFIRMLQEDEETFKGLAYKLREVITKQNIN